VKLSALSVGSWN